MKFFLQQPSDPAGPDDLPIAQDLAETLESHRATCVGMAANMIGQRKRIIAVMEDDKVLLMLNPTIKWGKEAYETEEGCLSLDGTRRTKRFKRIRVTWEDTDFTSHERTFTGQVAQAIQHEVDHCNGVLI